MRILVVDEWIPYPLDSGKKIRTFNLLAPLARRHEITYLSCADPVQDAAKIEQMKKVGFRVRTVPPGNRFRTPLSLAFGIASNLFSPTPLAVRKHATRPFLRELRRLLSREHFDLIHCEWTHYAHHLSGIHDLPKFLSSHNVECIPWRRLAEVERNPMRRAGLHLEWLKMRSFEHRALAMFDHVAAVSDPDAHIMRSWFQVESVSMIANGVDLEFYEKIAPSEQGDHVVFCASMNASVNQDAVMYFVKQVLPMIWEKRPGLRFMIVGSKPPPFITALASDRVIVTGSVEDVRPLLGQAAACVVPLRIAGGSRLKILEAFAAGLSVVSTSIGAEGLDVELGKHLLIADGEAAFADATIRLLEDRSLRQRLTAASRKLVQECYDWKKIVPKVEEAWERTIGNYIRKRGGPASSSTPVDPRCLNAPQSAQAQGEGGRRLVEDQYDRTIMAARPDRICTSTGGDATERPDLAEAASEPYFCPVE